MNETTIAENEPKKRVTDGWSMWHGSSLSGKMSEMFITRAWNEKTEKAFADLDKLVANGHLDISPDKLAEINGILKDTVGFSKIVGKPELIDGTKLGEVVGKFEKYLEGKGTDYCQKVSRGEAGSDLDKIALSFILATRCIRDSDAFKVDFQGVSFHRRHYDALRDRMEFVVQQGWKFGYDEASIELEEMLLLHTSTDPEGKSRYMVKQEENLKKANEYAETTLVKKKGALKVEDVLDIQEMILSEIVPKGTGRRLRNYEGGVDSGRGKVRAEFAEHRNLPEITQKLLDDIKEAVEWCPFYATRDDVVGQVAIWRAHFDAIHPLQEANGRVGSILSNIYLKTLLGTRYSLEFPRAKEWDHKEALEEATKGADPTRLGIDIGDTRYWPDGSWKEPHHHVSKLKKIYLENMSLDEAKSDVWDVAVGIMSGKEWSLDAKDLEQIQEDPGFLLKRFLMTYGEGSVGFFRPISEVDIDKLVGIAGDRDATRRKVGEIVFDYLLSEKSRVWSIDFQDKEHPFEMPREVLVKKLIEFNADEKVVFKNITKALEVFGVKRNKGEFYGSVYHALDEVFKLPEYKRRRCYAYISKNLNNPEVFRSVAMYLPNPNENDRYKQYDNVSIAGFSESLQIYENLAGYASDLIVLYSNTSVPVEEDSRFDPRSSEYWKSVTHALAWQLREKDLPNEKWVQLLKPFRDLAQEMKQNGYPVKMTTEFERCVSQVSQPGFDPKRDWQEVIFGGLKY